MKNSLFNALSSRQFQFLWVGEILTQIPVNLLNFLFIVIVFDITKSNTFVSGIVLSFTLPAVFFGTIAGIYIDQWNKKKVLYISNFLRALCILFLAFFHSNIIVVFVLAFLISIITQFFIPAESPIIPLIVSDKLLLSANALFGIGIFGSILLAFIFSGPLLITLGLVNTLLLLAGMLLLASFLISLIRVPATEEAKGIHITERMPVKTFIQELRHTFRIITSSKDVFHSLFLLAISQILILIIASIAPGYANEVLHIRVEQFPLLVITPAAIGIIIGAILLTNTLHRFKLDHIVTLGLFLSGIAISIMPYGSKLASRHFIVAANTVLPQVLKITHIDIIILLSFFLGIANAFVFVPSNTLLLEKTSDQVRGRIYGVLNTFVGIFSFIPIIVVGSFSDLIGVSRVLMGIGISLIILGITRLFV